MSVGLGRVAQVARGAVDRALHHVGGVLVWLGSNATVRHELRVRRRCGVWRYGALMGSALVMPRARQWVFQWRLRRCARRVSVSDLLELLDLERPPVGVKLGYRMRGLRGRVSHRWVYQARRIRLRTVMMAVARARKN